MVQEEYYPLHQQLFWGGIKLIQNLIKSGIDDESRPFWNGVEEERLLIQLCDDCHHYIFYPRSICPHCFSEQINWIEAQGTGRIYSYTIVHQAYGPFKDKVPYVVGVVELDEGVRMMSWIIGNHDDIRIDNRVVVVFKEIESNFVLPQFKVIP